MEVFGIKFPGHKSSGARFIFFKKNPSFDGYKARSLHEGDTDKTYIVKNCT